MTQYKALDIAYFFISKVQPEKGDSLTPLKLQKLVYYSQAWYYTLFNKPLFDEKIEAWAHGPVVKSVWDKFKNFYTRHEEIDIKGLTYDVPKFDDTAKKILADIKKIYGEHSGSYLERLTHNETPWLKARKDLPSHAASSNEITLKSMKDYYSTLVVKK